MHALVLASFTLLHALPLVVAHQEVHDEPGPGLEVSAITFNIRYGTADDGPNAWPHRRAAVLEFIDESGADFIGLQEVLAFQLEEIHRSTSDSHASIARSRGSRDGDGEATPLLYRRDRWRLDDDNHGTFWLSKTPEVPGSMSWETSLPRIVTWGRFIERDTDRAIWVFNTHFDHRSQAARLEGARLLARTIGELVSDDAPVIVLGDLNAGEESAPLKALRTGAGEHPVELVDSWRVRHPNDDRCCTINGWGTGVRGRKIDYVLVPRGSKIVSATIHRTRVDGRPISDHWPVSTTVTFLEEEE